MTLELGTRGSDDLRLNGIDPLLNSCGSFDPEPFCGHLIFWRMVFLSIITLSFSSNIE